MPSCPTPTGPSVPSIARRDCLSWGLSKDRPSVVPASGVHSRNTLADVPSERACHGPFVFRPRGFSPPRRLAPSKTCACIATRSRPWGSPRFDARSAGCPARLASPRDAFPALRSFPSAGSCSAPFSSSARTRARVQMRGGRTSPARCRTVHRSPCPLALSFPLPDPSPRSPARVCPVQFRRASRPSSTTGSVAPSTVARRYRPVLPWACPGSPLTLPANGKRNEVPGGTSKTAIPTP